MTREKIETREVVHIDVREALLNPTVIEKKVRVLNPMDGRELRRYRCLEACVVVFALIWPFASTGMMCQVGTGFNMRALMVDRVHSMERELDVDR